MPAVCDWLIEPWIWILRSRSTYTLVLNKQLFELNPCLLPMYDHSPIWLQNSFYFLLVWSNSVPKEWLQHKLWSESCPLSAFQVWCRSIKAIMTYSCKSLNKNSNWLMCGGMCLITIGFHTLLSSFVSNLWFIPSFQKMIRITINIATSCKSAESKSSSQTMPSGQDK